MTVVERRIYLDHNATSPLLPEAREALIEALDLVGNPSSVHREGRQARAIVEAARRDVAALAGADAENVVFTGGATEAAVTCLTPLWYRDGAEFRLEALAVLESDHPATREGGRFPLDAVTRLGVDADGIIEFGELSAWLDRFDGASAMLAIGHASGETGVVQPIRQIQEYLHGHNVVFVLDASQTAGRLPLEIASLGADAILLSGHKLGASKGVGAMVLGRETLRPERLVPGGGQEKGLRSGTEALPAIASFGTAARTASRGQEERTAAWNDLRDRFLGDLEMSGIEFVLLGENIDRLANTVSLAFPAKKAESVQIALDLRGFATSSGSACSSGKVGASHALNAMAKAGAPVDPALGLLRISFGRDTTADELKALSAALMHILPRREPTATGRGPIAA